MLWLSSISLHRVKVMKWLVWEIKLWSLLTSFRISWGPEQPNKQPFLQWECQFLTQTLKDDSCLIFWSRESHPSQRIWGLIGEISDRIDLSSACGCIFRMAPEYLYSCTVPTWLHFVLFSVITSNGPSIIWKTSPFQALTRRKNADVLMFANRTH